MTRYWTVPLITMLVMIPMPAKAEITDTDRVEILRLVEEFARPWSTTIRVSLRRRWVQACLLSGRTS